MAGLFAYLNRLSNYFVLFLLLPVIVVSGWTDPAYASNACKSWVTASDGCDSRTNCIIHGAILGDSNSSDQQGIDYTSDSSRDIYTLWPGWLYPSNTLCATGCSKTAQNLQCNACASPNKIISLNGFTNPESVTITIRAGETLHFFWALSGCIDNTTLTVAGKTFSNVSYADWTGTDADDHVTEPKTYTAVLTASGDCCGADTKYINIIVLPPPDSCPFIWKHKSSVNLATGSLLQSEALFAARGGSLAAAISLTYDSLDPRTGPLGPKWSHSYDIGLIPNLDGSVALREGNKRRLYSLSGGVYVPDNGDYSTLVRSADNTFTLTYKDGTKKKFNGSGQLIAITDMNGNSLAFAHDPSGNLASVIDAAGRTTTFAYDATNRLTTITDPAGKNYTFTYSSNMLSTVIWPDNSSWQYTYNAKGFMLNKTDPLDKITTYTYDASHRVLTGTDSAGTKSVAYPTATTTVKSTSFTEEDGGVWTTTYDSHNAYITARTDPYGKTTSYTYDANRNLTRETAPDGSFTSYTYDAAGNRLSMTDALGNTTTFTYNSLGQVTSSTDPLGRTSSSSYDVKGNLVQTIDAVGAKTSYTYDARGNLTGVTNPLGQTSTFTYDAANNQTAATDPTGATTTSTYDGMGHVLTRTDPLGKVTTFEYDGRYRLAKVTDPLGNVTSYIYDAKGNKTSRTDANGNITRYEYDDQGHLVKTIDAAGFTTTYTYGATGCPSCGGGSNKLTSLTDAKNQTTGFQYDLLGHLTRESDPLSKTTNYTYDMVGNLISRTDANGTIISYTYDAMKRLTKKSYPDNSSESYTYDAVGRLLTAGNANVTYTYAYDTSGRVASVTDNRGYTITYEYDQAGNRTRMTFQPGTVDQRITTYAYDNNGRLTGITSPAGTFTYGYDSIGRRTSLAYPNQVTTSYGYDDGGRLTSLNHTAGGTAIAAFTYTLDQVGNRTSKAAAELENYVYDLVYRLLTVTSTKPETFSFDPVGNRLTGPGAKDTGYLYNAGNQMTQGRRLAYGYDNAGNQITRTVPITADKSWVQTWDYENRLVKVEKLKGAEKRTVSFSYDPSGRRIGKQMTVVKDGVTKTSSWNYVYDNDNIALEAYTDETGAVTKTFYTHGAGVDEHLALERNGQFYYYHADGLGSMVVITDSSKAVVQAYEFDSFGMVKLSTGFRNSYTYTGREWDKETGLYYYRARYYDPMEGRFISKDPIGFKGGVNEYSYVKNDPINGIDPTGLIKIHGNWCGPNWTGGQIEQFTPGHKYKDPVDTLDTYCMIHDMCYYECRKNYACDLIGRDLCMTKCDRELANGAAFSGHTFSPLWLWMNFNSTPDPGPDAPCCKAK
jgi:RHS repeat-associated protein